MSPCETMRETRVDPMSMVRLIYVSRMTDVCDMEALQEILKVSKTNNAAARITGMLCYDPMFFLQCLEGPRTAVNEVYRHILRDDRHTDVVLLEYADIQERAFGRWSMGFLRSSEIDVDTIAAYAGGEKLDPYRLRGDRARDFLLTVEAQERNRLAAQV